MGLDYNILAQKESRPETTKEEKMKITKTYISRPFSGIDFSLPLLKQEKDLRGRMVLEKKILS